MTKIRMTKNCLEIVTGDLFGICPLTSLGTIVSGVEPFGAWDLGF